MALVDNCGARCPQTQFQVNAEEKNVRNFEDNSPTDVFLFVTQT